MLDPELAGAKMERLVQWVEGEEDAASVRSAGSPNLPSNTQEVHARVRFSSAIIILVKNYSSRWR